ncbi:MAG TPA: S9 family peptidase [Gemmatimonadales bacterium]|nr:S9 family peptidase [Gemmatimonadales bacterium]
MFDPPPPLPASSSLATLEPPVADRRPHVTVLHGERLVDDYFWLRSRDDPAVTAYLTAENSYAEAVLAPTRELQEVLYREMLGRVKETDVSVPYREGNFWYYVRTREGLQYPVYCRRRTHQDAPEQVTLDLNLLAEGHPYLGLGALDLSDDGRLMAYSTDYTGFRRFSLVVKDLDTGEQVAGPLDKTGSLAWAADNRTLFYSVEDEAKRFYQVWRYELGGTPELVLEETDERFRLQVSRTRSRRYVVMQSDSHTASEVRVVPADAPRSAVRLLVPRAPDRELEVDHLGDGWLLRVNDTGPNFRVVRLPEEGSAPGGEIEMLPHRDDVMVESLDAFAGHWIAWERSAGLIQARVTDRDTGSARYVPFDEPVYEARPGPNPEWSSSVLRFQYESPVTPPSVYDYDMATGARTLLKQREVPGLDPRRYGSERRAIPAADGTPIPVSLVYRREPPLGRPAPVLLTGYGAYRISVPAGFSSNRVSLLDRGVIVAIAHVRGGGELGKRWHDAGRMAHKENSFGDFAAVAEALVNEGLAQPRRLAIEGGSAGGLLVTATANLRPDLFGAVVAQVPFVDVINTMLDPSLPLTVGEYEEWGNPAVPEQYAWLRRYCPYTNLAARAYPAMLVRTSRNDSQVMFWEPAKYVAKLRALKTDANPLLLVTNLGAGHGGASGRYDRLREIAMDYAFLLWQLGLDRRP